MRKHYHFVAGTTIISMVLVACGLSPRNQPIVENPSAPIVVTYAPESTSLASSSAEQAIATPFLVTESNYNPNPEVIRQYVLDHKQDPLELLIELAQENQTMTIGEAHDHTNAKRFIADSLYDLVQYGGIEFLAVEVDRINQEDIDNYMAGTITAEELRVIIPYIDNACSIYMLDKAREAGIPVYAIDGEEIDEDMIRNMRYQIFSDNPNAKGVVYIGARHTIEDEIGYGNLFLGGLLDDLSGGRNASIWINPPSDVSELVDVQGLPSMIGFRTDYAPLADMRFQADNSNLPSLDLYYGLDMDAMILLD